MRNQKDAPLTAHPCLSHHGKSGPERVNVQEFGIIFKLSPCATFGEISLCPQLQPFDLLLYPGSCLEPAFGVRTGIDHVVTKAAHGYYERTGEHTSE